MNEIILDNFKKEESKIIVIDPFMPDLEIFDSYNTEPIEKSIVDLTAQELAGLI